MYCPKCGATLGEQGNFCARCGKNVTYLRDKESAGLAGPESAREGRNFIFPPNPEPPESPSGTYYCIYCGTAVFGEDNHCYNCGKVLLKEYYNRKKKSRKFIIAAALSIVLILSAVAAYVFFAGSHALQR